MSSTEIHRDKVTEKHRSGRPLVASHTDDRFIVNIALWNPDHKHHTTPGTFKAGERHSSVTLDHLKPFTLMWSAC